MPRMVRVAVAAGVLALALASPVLAQIDANLGALNAENVKGYLSPLPKALSTTLNMAEFQSASIPLAGFNLTVGVHVMAVTFADDDKTYDVKDPIDGSVLGKASTVAGSTLATDFTRSDNTVLYHPGGLGLSQFTVAVPQLAIGSVLGTRAVVRWIQFDAGDSDFGKVDFLGIGLQHSLNRYLKGLPVDLAAGGMYQTFSLGKDKLIDTKAMHFEVTASRKLALWVQPYAGVGYDTFSMEANYTPDASVASSVPTNVKFDDENGFHGTLGVMFGFPLVKLHAQVDQAKETGAAVGLRFGLGN